MRKILLIIMAILLFGRIAVAQQDAQFSQYMFNGIYINPAYAGYKEQLNLHAFYRNQWTGVDGSPKTMSLAVDAIANEGNVGLALQVSSDKLGAQRNLAVYGNYAYRIRMNAEGSSRLAFGLGFGAVQLGIDGALLNPNDPEPNQPSGFESVTLPDARVGAYFSNDRLYIGVSADNLISQYAYKEDNNNFVPHPRVHYYLTAGVLIPLSQEILIKPSFLVKDDRGGPTSLDLTSFLIFSERFWIGGSYRTGIKLYNKDYLQKNLSQLNSASVAAQVFASENLRIGYAYDFSIGALKGYGGGTHEISIGYFFNKKRVRMLSPRYF